MKRCIPENIGLGTEATLGAIEGEYILGMFVNDSSNEVTDNYRVCLTFAYEYEPNEDSWGDLYLETDVLCLNMWPAKTRDEVIRLFYEKVDALETLTGETMNVKEVLI